MHHHAVPARSASEQSATVLPASAQPLSCDLSMAPEQEARAEIDKLLAGSVQPRDQVDLTAAQGVVICEYPLKKGHGFAGHSYKSTEQPSASSKPRRPGSL